MKHIAITLSLLAIAILATLDSHKTLAGTDYESLYEGPGAIDESDGHTKVFPIPAEVRALNKNLTQNPGY